MAAVFEAAAIAASWAGTSIYFIGNSVTDTVQYDKFLAMARAAESEVEIGRHTIPGSPLSWTWEHPDGGSWSEEHGPFLKALSSRSWNVLSLQPFDRQLDGDADSDAVMGANFIREALKGTPEKELRVLVYSRWPRRDDENASTFYGRSFGDQWDRQYVNPSYDGANETRDYFEQVLENWRSQFPGLQIDLVPVGDVLARLDEKIAEGKVPEIQAITDLYSDSIHFDRKDPPGYVGSYIVALTFYSTIFGQSPEGDETFTHWGIENPDLARALQETVWEVVSSHPQSGVKPVAASSGKAPSARPPGS